MNVPNILLAFLPILIFYISIVAHELGHFAADILVGQKSDWISLGSPKIFSFNLFGTGVDIGLFPIKNFVYVAPEKWNRLCWIQKIFTAAAGPFVSLFLVWFGLWQLGMFHTSLPLLINTFIRTVEANTFGFLFYMLIAINLIIGTLSFLPLPGFDGELILLAIQEAFIGKKVWLKYHSALHN